MTGGAPGPTTTTFLFTDIEGSARQWEERPEMSDRVARHFAVLRASVAAFGGEVFATMGDGVAAAFGSADAAVHAAIDAQRRLPEIGLDVRMGVHTGDVEPTEDDFRGRAVNRAARIMAIGHGGQILVSDIVASLVRSGPATIELADLGTHRLRGLAEPERVWQVLDPRLRQEFRPVRTEGRRALHLPTPRSSLVGRATDVERVVGLLGCHRIVTLTGVGGVGKTRLALHASAESAAAFRDIWFVELASVADPDDIADAIARTLGVTVARDARAAVGAMLGGERTLLVVDNCEHVVDGVADLIDQLTAECPSLSVLATSREPLGIEGEHVVPVRPLDAATTAVELFRQRAESAGADVAAFDPAVVEQICRRLDGLPLAVELAAARAATLGAAAILDALDDRFLVLRGGRRRALDRHGTMRSTIDWSHRLLLPEQQRLFQWLAVFPNGFELDAARHVAAALGIDEFTATEHVASLVHRSMLATESAPGGVRYRMLETMRAYAFEQLDGRGERMVASIAHAEWVATLTDLPVATPCTAEVERCAIRLEREAESWRDAVLLAQHLRSGVLGGRLCGPPVAYFLLGRHDLAEVVRPLLDLCGDHLHHRRSVLTAMVVSAAGSADPAEVQTWVAEIQALDGVEPTGVGELMAWMALAWRGEFVESVARCSVAARDDRYATSTRDLFVGIATLDHFSLTDTPGDPHGLVPMALDVIDRTDVAMHRVTSLLGVAWGVAEADPELALELVRRAMQHVDDVPALTRLTLPGTASRLLTQLDPAVAAQGLLAQMAETRGRRTFVDLIPVCYATALLDRVGHPAAHATLAALAVTEVGPDLSMMDCVDVARRAAGSSSVASLVELEDVVQAALRDLAASVEPGACADVGR